MEWKPSAVRELGLPVGCPRRWSLAFGGALCTKLCSETAEPGESKKGKRALLVTPWTFLLATSKYIWLKWATFGTEEIRPNDSSSLSSVRWQKLKEHVSDLPKVLQEKQENQTLRLECLERTQLPVCLTAARGHGSNAAWKTPSRKSHLWSGHRGLALRCSVSAFAMESKNKT